MRTRGALALVFALLLSGIPQVQGHAESIVPRLSAEDGRIVDELGRTVLLRGVNVNQLVDYWAGTEFPTVFPLPETDFDLIASFGWNAVRLLVSWSRVEPEPGVYDDAYVERIAEAARWAGGRGVYVILDLHQDAWGPHLAARPGELCPPGSVPAIGWDGAPEWATLDDGLPRCYLEGNRQVNQAVAQSFQSFWVDRPGPDGVGVQTRYHSMLKHLAQRFTEPWIAGIDIMNEPNPGYAIGANDVTLLRLFHLRATAAIREGEAEAAAPPKIVFYEPGIEWSLVSVSPSGPYTLDRNVVYAPHIYTGSINPGDPVLAHETVALTAAPHGGPPVLIGEWGAWPGRAGPAGDGYFVLMQDLQDQHLFSQTMWTWRESCGDPHKAEDIRAGGVPEVWGLFEVDCRTNEILGMRETLRFDLLRAYPRAAPGVLTSTRYDHHTGTFSAAGNADGSAGRAEIVYPAPKHGVTAAEGLQVDAMGLEDVQVRPGPTDELLLVTAVPTGGAWTLEVSPVV